MQNKKSSSEERFAALRQQAEELISQQSQPGKQPPQVDIRGLVHELEVHQIELEMQNEELVQAQVELEKSRDRYIDLYDFAPVGYLTLNAKGVILEANLTATRLLGVERRRLVRQRLSNFVFGDDQNAFYFFSKKLFEAQSQLAEEVRLTRSGPGGKPVYALLEGLTTPDEGGEIICHLSISDISKQKAVEQALAESEQRFRTMSNFTQDWEYWVSPTMEYIYISPSCEVISGYKPEEFRSDPALLAKILYPEDGEVWQKHEDLVRQSNQPGSVDLRILTRAGEVRWINHVCRPVFTAEGKWLGRRISNRDITARKQAEQALLENQANMEALLEFTTGIVWSIDNQYRLIAGNDHFRKNYIPVLGREIQPGESTLPENMPEVYAEWRGYYERALAGEIFTIDSPTRAQPELRFLEYTFRPVYTLSGAVSGVIISGRDVTEQKQTEEELKQSEALFSKAFFDAPVALSIARRSNGKFLEVNDRYLQLYGFERSELIGHTSIELGIYANAEERAKTGNKMKVDGFLRDMERTTHSKTGKPLWVLVSAVPVMLNGEECLLATTLDITERKKTQQALEQSEALFSKAFFDAPVPFYIVRASDGMFIEVNERFLKLFGYERDEIIGHTSVELSFFSSIEERSKVNYKYATDGFLRDEEITTPNKAGEKVWALVSAVPVMMNGEGCNLGTLLDITQRRKAEIEREELIDQLSSTRELQQVLSTRLLQAQENERRVIARELHDEVGQALTALKINLQTVQRLKGNALDLSESVAMVEQTLQEVRSISRNLPPTMLEDLGLALALRWLLDRQGREAGFTTAFITGLGETRLPAYIELACFRVAQEALTNVVRHAHANHVNLELALGKQEISLTIEDDGDGFDVDESFARARQGNSLGLISMQERVYLAGGRMEIETLAGHGTKIHASFPLDLNGGGSKDKERMA